ncbi:MAG: cyclic nucleotide-binding domain-containing protein, partial [Rhodospirillales bacterium]|nr:cyclic nucleotide-binding domain-containing protein [Rhodospirillales bacterium]
MAERTVVQRPERWDKPFDPEMSEARVDRILAMAPFDTMDPSSFPRSAPLRDIVRNDIRFRTFNDAEIIIRKGDFGTSAYLLISGNALVVLPPGLSEATLGRSKFQKKTFFQGLLQLWNNPRGPEVRNPDLITAAPVNAGDWVVDGDPDTAKLDLGKIRKTFKTLLIEPGSLFGEIAALSRSARTTTIIAEGTTEILEIRRQGIRDIRRCDEQFRKNVDTLYRENSLSAHLGQTPIFAHLDAETIQMIAAKTLFETYGDFDWHISYNRMLSKPSQDRLAEEPLIVREGDYPDGLLLLRSGFARVSRRLNHGAKTVEYLSSGSTFGLPEIAHNWRHDTREPIGLQHSLRAVGYTDILRVPTTIIEELVLPTIPDSMHPASVERRFLQVMPHKERRKSPPKLQSAAENQAVGLMESLVEYRYINGTAAMVIDLDRCIR